MQKDSAFVGMIIYGCMNQCIYMKIKHQVKYELSNSEKTKI